ncbi:helix-turn-helix domain-containing protein [Saccharothrix sp. 6-C]|uniref:helix-turn-helix domain-containing protein n=1 Tax=Saccharothrix sp. 6-C TaxID=2781735 RepID=UPI001916CE88|nr:helix-turn-helix transcriptional regulator [Saccharothrix sp. 6-C]QQQ77330.1 helix-turn-helix domain-containing protein [Saccharothrix sp. 6-C]
MIGDASPVLYKAELGEALRRAREQVGLEREDAARALGCSVSKIRTIERGQVSIRPAELRDLLDCFRVDPAERADLEHLAELARQRKPRTPWGSAVPDRLRRFFAAEETAAVIQVYQPALFQGLVQTEDYARAVIGTNTSLVRADVDRLVQARLARQAVLTAPRPPKVTMVLDEHVLHALIGGREVMAEQVRHVADLARREVVEIRVIPTAAGAHAGFGAPAFLVLTPPGRPSVVYVETLTDGLFVDDPERIHRYEAVMAEMKATALTAAASLSLLDTVAAEL